MTGMIFPQPQPAPEKPPRLETLERCPLCADRVILSAPVQPDPPFGLKQCCKCFAIFLSPRPPAGEMKTYYDQFYDAAGEPEAPSPRQERRARRHLRRLTSYFPRAPGGSAGVPAGRLLEVGAGDGYFLKAARDDGWQVEGVELSEPRIARAKKWFGLELRCAELAAAPFEPQSFDAAAMFQLIEHVHDPRGVIERVHALLRPGGILMLSTPNVLAYARKGRDVNSWRIPRHLFFFTPRTLVRTVEALGFEVLRKPLKFYASLEEKLGWQPWPNSGPLARVTRDLWTPFGLHLVAKKKV